MRKDKLVKKVERMAELCRPLSVPGRCGYVEKELTRLGIAFKYFQAKPGGKSCKVVVMSDSVRLFVRCGYGRCNYAPCYQIYFKEVEV